MLHSRALERNYTARKPIVDVESDYYGHSLVRSPYTADAVRLEGWWFLLGGGAGVINLNGEFHRGQEDLLQFCVVCGHGTLLLAALLTYQCGIRQAVVPEKASFFFQRPQ